MESELLIAEQTRIARKNNERRWAHDVHMEATNEAHRKEQTWKMLSALISISLC